MTVAASLLIVTAALMSPLVNRMAPVAVRATVPAEAKLVAQAPVVAPIAPAPDFVRSSHVPSQDQVAALVDSLIDHSDDVDFVIDPVRVSRERTAGRRLEPAQGQQAVINF